MINKKEFKEKLKRYIRTSQFKYGMMNAAQDLAVEQYRNDEEIVVGTLVEL